MSKRQYVFPEMLKILLEEREMTQRGLAFKIRSSPYTVWAWLNKGTVPSAIMLTEVAEVFNVYRVIKPVLMIFSMNGIVTKKNAHTRQKNEHKDTIGRAYSRKVSQNEPL